MQNVTAELRKFEEGTAVKIESESTIHYFFRGKAKNNRIQVKCFTNNHKRYPHLDCNLPKTIIATKHELIA